VGIIADLLLDWIVSFFLEPIYDVFIRPWLHPLCARIWGQTFGRLFPQREDRRPLNEGRPARYRGSTPRPRGPG
jgi:hypothetical protein